MSGVPILVEAAALRVLVVGGGAVGARKARALGGAGARVRVISPAVCADMRALVEAGSVELVSRPYAPGDVGDAELVIAATDDGATNAAVAAEARAAHRLVNVADAPASGSFSTMATHRSGGLLVGVSAGVPAAAARIRDDIALRFDERYATAVERLAVLRDSLLAAGEAPRWRSISTRALDASFCAAVENGSFEERLR